MGEEKRYTPSISLAESQRNWIKKEANKEGISYTNYMRKVVLGELPQADVPYRKEDRRLQFNNGVSTEDMEKLLDYDISKVGNNLNQIARKLNEGVPADDKMVEQMREIREDMNQITDTILTALS